MNSSNYTIPTNVEFRPMTLALVSHLCASTKAVLQPDVTLRGICSGNLQDFLVLGAI